MQEITKENIAEVLEYNGIKDFFVVKGISGGVTLNHRKDYRLLVRFKIPNWLQIIEAAIFKKLEPLPESSPWDKVKVGQWVKFKGYTNRAFTNSKWYKIGGDIINKTITLCDDGNVFSGILINSANFIRDWDLSNPLDYNPDEEIVLQVGDVVEIDTFALGINTFKIECFDYVKQRIFYKCGASGGFDEDFYSVNGRKGKFIIPPFDFEQTLLNAGFIKQEFISSGELYYINAATDGSLCVAIDEIKPTPQNAQALIMIKTLIEGLKKQNATS